MILAIIIGYCKFVFQDTEKTIFNHALKCFNVHKVDDTSMENPAGSLNNHFHFYIIRLFF
jgi:hypothetical protein